MKHRKFSATIPRQRFMTNRGIKHGILGRWRTMRLLRKWTVMGLIGSIPWWAQSWRHTLFNPCKVHPHSSRFRNLILEQVSSVQSHYATSTLFQIFCGCSRSGSSMGNTKMLVAQWRAAFRASKSTLGWKWFHKCEFCPHAFQCVDFLIGHRPNPNPKCQYPTKH